MIDQTIYLDVVPGGLPSIINVSQFDEGSRTLHINLYASSGEFEIPAGSTAKVQGTKRDKKGFSYSATLNGTEVICDITQNMTAIAGRVYCEVVIENGEDVLATANFILMVKQAAFGTDTDISDSDLPDFYELANQIAQDAQNAQNAAAAAEQAAENAAQFTPEGYQQMKSDVGTLKTTVSSQGEQLEEEITKNIFGFGKPVKKDIYRKRLAIQTLSGDSGYTTLQGGCYLPTKQHFLMAIVNDDNNSCILVELDTDYETVISRTTLDLGHANDLTYNPDDGKIYVATGRTGTNANKIAVLNGSTFALENTLNLGNSRAKWLISYDDVNNRYYVLDTDYLTIYNSNWGRLKQYENVYKDQYAGECEMNAQSSFCYNGKFIALYFAREIVSASQRISAIYLQMIDYDTGAVSTIAQYSPRGNSDEPEFVGLIGDIGYMFGGQTYFSVSEIYFDQEKIYDFPKSIFGIAQLIDSNGDLNEYQMPGIYYSPNTDYTTGIENAPVTNGFTLYVIPVSGNVIVQQLINSAGDFYKRVLSANTNNWLDWEIMESSNTDPSDTGWVTLRLTGNYESVAAHPMQVKKVGNLVELSGAVRNTTNQIAGSTAETTLGVTLATQYRPSKMVVIEGTTSDDQVCQIRVNTNGTVTASRAIAPGTSGYTSIPANTAIFIHAMYFAAT